MQLPVGYVLDGLLYWELKVWGLTLGLSSASLELGRTGPQAYLACPWALAKLHAHSCDRESARASAEAWELQFDIHRL